jgi:outer membrane receptor protein involved in Fe transport
LSIQFHTYPVLSILHLQTKLFTKQKVFDFVSCSITALYHDASFSKNFLMVLILKIEMKKNLFSIFALVIVFVFCSKMIIAQGYKRAEVQNDIPRVAKVTGTIIDGASNQAVPYASIAIYQVKDSTLLTGVLSNSDGSFAIEKLPYGKFYVIVTFVGYKPHRVNNISLTQNQKIAALGTIKVNVKTTALNEVTIVGTIPPVTYQIDKKVINIAQNITAAGGTLADALQNAPSIQTDVEGNITVRGSSNFTVLVDGRPSPVAGSEALQQIPANLVEDVEIITNPSAKYEAEGSAGIINIIMKKQKIQGSSGLINLTAGTGNKYSANISLNYKLSKFNFTLGGDFSDNESLVKNNSSSADTLGQMYLKNHTVNGTGSFHRQGRGIHAEIDYTIDDKSSLTLTGSLGTRNFSRPLTSLNHDVYNNLLSPPSTDIYYLSSVSPEAERSYKTLNLDYELKLDSKGQKLSASAYYTGGPNNNVSLLTQDTTDVNWLSLGKTSLLQQTSQNSNGNEVRTKADYELPIGKKGKLGAGYLGKYSDNNGSYNLQNYTGGVWILDITKRDQLNFKDQIQALYVTVSNTMPLFDYQLGLRSEYEDRLLDQLIQNKSYSLNRIDFFPTIHLTRQLPWNLQLQTSYTRRINRPQMSSLDPFIVHLDPQTIRQGNAGLIPEFANSYELNLEKKLKGNSFISVEGFLRQTTNLIQQISNFDPATQITTNTSANIDHDRSMGTELMMYLEPKKWFNINTSFNLFNYHMFGTPIPSVANSTNTWNIHINPTFHLDKKTSVQFSYIYNAPTITAQGTRSGFYSSTFAVRHIILKNKGSLALQARDPVGKTIYTSTTQSAHQYKYSSFERESQVFILTFSYRINNYRVSKNNKQNQDESDNSEQDMERQGF